MGALEKEKERREEKEGKLNEEKEGTGTTVLQAITTSVTKGMHSLIHSLLKLSSVSFLLCYMVFFRCFL
jgi:hypothetical protein